MKTSVMLCAVIMATVVSVHGTAIEFGSTSTSIKPLITTNMTMRCSLHDTTPSVSGGLVGRKKRDVPVPDSSSYVADPNNPVQKRKSLSNTTDNVDFVTSMVISKDGVDIATLSAYVPATSMINSLNLHVTGSLSGQPGERGFLELTWQHPTKAESGNYRCDVDSINKQGHSFDFSKTLEINEEEISLSDLVSHVQKSEREKEDMKKTIETMKGTIVTMNETIDTMNGTIDTMKGTIGTMNGTIDTMKKSEENMSKTISDLVSEMNKTHTNVFFSVGLTHSLSTSQVVLYDRVFTNEGGAYQPGTGVFTCPVGGFYTFILSGESDSDQNLDLHLQRNNKYLLRLYSLSGHGYQGTTNSLIVKLDKGDTVNVWSYQTIYASSAELTTTFSGHLIAVV